MDEKAKVKDAINAFYQGAGLDLKFTGEVNAKVAEVFGDMIFETQKCSAAMNWVPRPTGGKATIAWVARNFGRSILGKLSDKQSLTCAKAVVRNYRTKLTLASLGM